jgi:hypothetical protein
MSPLGSEQPLNAADDPLDPETPPDDEPEDEPDHEPVASI